MGTSILCEDTPQSSWWVCPRLAGFRYEAQVVMGGVGGCFGAQVSPGRGNGTGRRAVTSQVHQAIREPLSLYASPGSAGQGCNEE